MPYARYDIRHRDRHLMPKRDGDDALLATKRTGRTLLDIMWEDLIRCIDMLMSDKEDLVDWTDEDRIRCQGRAEGVAYCIAVMTQTPKPINISLIKEEAMERWEAEQAE